MVDIDDLTGASRESQLLGEGYEPPEARLIASLERGEPDGCVPDPLADVDATVDPAVADEPVISVGELDELAALDTTE